MLSIDISIILLQLIAALLMGIAYFTDSYLLKVYDRYFDRKLNKLSNDSRKLIPIYYNTYENNKFILNLSIVFIILGITMVCVIFPKEVFLRFINESKIFIQTFFVMIITTIFLFIILLIKKIEPISEIIAHYIPILIYRIVLFSSKKGSVVGIGFVYLIFSLIMQLIQKFNIENEQALIFIQMFCTCLIISSLPIFIIIVFKYYKTL